ncbi:MAG: ChaN family lipoprotein [Planctomycetota bacterium]
MTSLLQLQKNLWWRVARRARALSTAGNDRLGAALEDFERSFPDKFRRVPRRTFLERAKGADWIFVGDYHSLPQAQLETARLVEELLPETLALEAFPSCYQAALDLWAESRRSAASLLDMVEFGRLWGDVPRAGFERLLETARQLGVRLLAIDHPLRAADLPAPFEERDAHMARVLSDHAKTPCMVLVGDVHLSPNSLPGRLGRSRSVLFHQNHAPYYFRLLQEDKDIPALLQISSRRYVWQHTHPLLVEESFLHTVVGDGMAQELAAEEFLPVLLTALGELFDIEPPPEPTVLATFDAEQRDLLALLVPEGAKTTRLFERLRIQGTAVLGEGGPVLLHVPGVNHMTEAAAKWMFHCLAEPLAPRAGRGPTFFHELRREAFGFLGSCLINPLRQVRGLDWFREKLGLRFDEDHAHRLEAAFGLALEQGRDVPLHRLPAKDSVEYVVLAHVLGQELGKRLLPVFRSGPEGRAGIVAAMLSPAPDDEAIQEGVRSLSRLATIRQPAAARPS